MKRFDPFITILSFQSLGRLHKGCARFSDSQPLEHRILSMTLVNPTTLTVGGLLIRNCDPHEIGEEFVRIPLDLRAARLSSPVFADLFVAAFGELIQVGWVQRHRNGNSWRRLLPKPRRAVGVCPMVWDSRDSDAARNRIVPEADASRSPKESSHDDKIPNDY